MRMAVEQLHIPPDYVLIDGNCDRGFQMPHSTVVGGDGSAPISPPPPFWPRSPGTGT
jgi:hypothetical protein